MNDYGITEVRYFIYKFYWLLFGIVLLITSALFWVRGIPNSFRERLSLAGKRFKGITAIGFIVFLVGFLFLGFSIYKENNIDKKPTSFPHKKNIHKIDSWPDKPREAIYTNNNVNILKSIILKNQRIIKSVIDGLKPSILITFIFNSRFPNVCPFIKISEYKE